MPADSPKSGIVFIATDSKQVIASIDKDMGDTGFLRLDKEARSFMSERLTNTE